MPADISPEPVYSELTSVVRPDDVATAHQEKFLPEGVLLRRLNMHKDERGVFTELFRVAWPMEISPIQWNAVATDTGVLRGVHVHLQHTDYLVLVQGQASIGLRDLRKHSPTAGWSGVVEMRGAEQTALTIPPGVAHGFYFHEPSLHIYAVSEYWNEEDELGCHWADPDLQIPWPMSSARVSLRDARLPSLKTLCAAVNELSYPAPIAPAA